MRRILLRVLIGMFQESHYDTALFVAWLKRHPRPQDWRAFVNGTQPHWSRKARVIFFLAFWLSLGQTWRFPFAIRMAFNLLRIPEMLAMQWLTWRTGRFLRRGGTKIVIGITGSYGKTTTKEILAAVLSQRFRVHRTPENVNTLLGIAQWVRSLDLRPTDVLVVEMGAYHRGDIASICRFVQPTMGILTGINEAHLSRFGSLEVTKAAKCELFDALAKVRGVGFWNQGSALTGKAVSERSPRWQTEGLTLVPYHAAGVGAVRVQVSPAAETSLRVRVLHTGDRPWQIEALAQGLFGRHHASPIAVAIALADQLGLSAEEIRRGIATHHPLPRRLAPSYGPDGRLVIDDSYNITLDGVRVALAALREIKRRKVGVFAGIPEGGPKADALNRELGRLIAPVFDQLILRVTPATVAIERGLQEGGWQGRDLFRYTSRGELEPILGRVLAPGDCLYLSAYDWPAIYL